MTKLTEVQKFQKFLKEKGFETSPVLNSLKLNPTYYKNESKDHVMLSAIHVCIFEGSDTKKGDLGCVTFSYHGKRKKYKCRNIDSSPEVFKETLLPNSANEAIIEFTNWKLWSQHNLKRWEKVF